MANKVGNFFTEVKQELAKVTWPSVDELKGATVVVLATTLILAVFVGTVDFILSLLVRLLLS